MPWNSSATHNLTQLASSRDMIFATNTNSREVKSRSQPLPAMWQQTPFGTTRGWQLNFNIFLSSGRAKFTLCWFHLIMFLSVEQNKEKLSLFARWYRTQKLQSLSFKSIALKLCAGLVRRFRDNEKVKKKVQVLINVVCPCVIRSQPAHDTQINQMQIFNHWA